jgi:uncharacterized lipoprotein YmbA
MNPLGLKAASTRFRFLAVIAMLLLTTGCFPKTRSAQFYLLQPMSPTAAQVGKTDTTKSLLIGLGPVDIPAYLDRPQIVTGGEGTQMHLNEFQRWAEPLRDNVTRVLAENLSQLLPNSHVLAFPWNRANPPDYQVEIQINRFHVDAAGHCELKANWTLLKHNKVVSQKPFSASSTVEGNDYDAKAGKLSLALAAFSRDIAAELAAFAP